MARNKQGKAPTVPRLIQVKKGELQTAFNGPAVRANKIYMSAMEGGVRISFAEQHGDAVSPQFRTAVFISFQEAVSLKDLLTHNLKAVEQAMMAAKLEAKKADGGQSDKST